jgi:hypothetical protein
MYFSVPGEVCVDLTSGKAEDRKAVLDLLTQAQEMARLLVEMRGSCESSVGCSVVRAGMGDADSEECVFCRAEKVLRDAGVK